MPRTRDLPNDVETLKRLLAKKDATLEAIRAQLHSKTVEIGKIGAWRWITTSIKPTAR